MLRTVVSNGQPSPTLTEKANKHPEHQRAIMKPQKWVAGAAYGLYDHLECHDGIL
ncbi:hypothetical protein GO993_11890 [Aeromonas salmonicida subsp. salmonicida]|nr:hypothetical protein GO994_16340 [Aeromonas salmonicida subsp. salmonicida]QJF56150.1 hypothetical protein GO993_11890 [Aeromonas salmonicida subsp. salmonicida]